jgi:hypothetical protein
MPTMKIVCERCEIDINSINKNVDTFDLGNIPDQQAIEFDIKVGQVTEEHINPILDYYFSDKLVNGKDRSMSQEAPDTTSVLGFEDENIVGGTKNLAERAITIASSRAATVALNNPDIGQRNMNTFKDHISGTPFNEQRNKKDAINNRLGTDGTQPRSATSQPAWDANIPNTWGGNALKLGGAYAENLLKDEAAKLAMTKIPGLGISVNEAIGVIESKNFITAFGLYHDAMRTVAATSIAPSQELDKEIQLSILQQFLANVASSAATDDDSVELKRFASEALHDRSILGKIMDYSAATDLVSKDLKEVNIPNPIKNPNQQSSIVADQTKGDFSEATNLVSEGEFNNPNPIKNPLEYSSIVADQTKGDLSWATDLITKDEFNEPNPIKKTQAILYDGLPTSKATNNPIIKP